MNILASKQNLYEHWVKNIGESKAILLTCYYPIKLVAEMEENEAQAEVEMIQEDLNKGLPVFSYGHNKVML